MISHVISTCISKLPCLCIHTTWLGKTPIHWLIAISLKQMALITILNHFISYLSKFINPPARNQETITFPEMIKVPYVSERVFYVWKHIVYPRVYHTNEPIKFPEILADGHEHQTSSSWIVPSVLATEVTPLLFLKRNSANFVKNAEVHGERGFDATSGGRNRWCSSLPF